MGWLNACRDAPASVDIELGCLEKGRIPLHFVIPGKTKKTHKLYFGFFQIGLGSLVRAYFSLTSLKALTASSRRFEALSQARLGRGGVVWYLTTKLLA